MATDFELSVILYGTFNACFGIFIFILDSMCSFTVFLSFVSVFVQNFVIVIFCR